MAGFVPYNFLAAAHRFVAVKWIAIALLFSTPWLIPPDSQAAPPSLQTARVRVGVDGRGKVEPAGGHFRMGKQTSFTAIPADGFVFRNWTDSMGAPLAFHSDEPTLRYTVIGETVVRANFIPNPFRNFAGTVNARLRSFDSSPPPEFRPKPAAGSQRFR